MLSQASTNPNQGNLECVRRPRRKGVWVLALWPSVGAAHACGGTPTAVVMPARKAAAPSVDGTPFGSHCCRGGKRMALLGVMPLSLYRPSAATCVLIVLLFARPCVARWNSWGSVSFDCNESRERGTNATLAERRQNKATNRSKLNRIMCNSAGLKGRSKKCPFDRSQNQGRFS